ncbi:MAG: PhnD/SsuA/transferrin family substrate-binding protein [Gammaproteobacteria bacterium]|nr:PhnD/SsuA/transferrin family substrate-binding protein [Gammaproteobacteria bacterium]
MSASEIPFIACGMYAFNDELQQAWRQLFDHYVASVDDTDESPALRLEADPALLQESGLVFGHTCGYPLMTRLKDRFTPFCMPVFDVPGTNGRRYSSRFIVASDSDIRSVEQSQGRVAAVNTPDSNSGMNVLRHAVARQNIDGQFFSRILASGGHLYSLQAVARGEADIAAIDCVSYQLIEDHWPELASRVETIGYSVESFGLPFVLPNSKIDDMDTGRMIERLNQALDSSGDAVRRRLHLREFAAVVLDDYQGILEIENFAIEQGYPELN